MIYFMQVVERGPIKIGTSTRPGERIQQVANDCGEDLRVLAVAKGGRPEEQRLHQRFAHLRLIQAKGIEWFEPAAELLAYIALQPKPPGGSDAVVRSKPSGPRGRTLRPTDLGLSADDAIGPYVAKNMLRLGYAEIVPRSTEIARLVTEKTGRTISRQRISAIVNSVNVEPETIDLLATAMGVEAEELTR